jgi:2-polyprenyl-3-methyl-5-hydroxy-6-metoxy-1,4-benzoquinol methylase
MRILENTNPENSMQKQPPALINEETLNGLLGRAITDFGGTSLAALVVIGDRLGLYRVLATRGPLTAAELADESGTHERYVREWLNAHAASGYVNYLADSGRYQLSAEQAMLFAQEDSPAFVVGGFQTALAAGRIVDRLTDAFRTGDGIGWHEHHHDMFPGCARFYRVGYLNHLVQEWIPALDGVQAKLEAGIRVADVGCGVGYSTLIMAKAFPKSRFTGFDIHAESIAAAIGHARDAGVTNVSFEIGAADDYRCVDGGQPYDFVAVFDALHDMGNPAAASRHVRDTLAPDGTWMIVEPYAGDRIEENLNPIGRAYYAASTLLCTPCSLSQEGRMGLGAQAGEARLRSVVKGAGFTRFRRATHSPVNLILEARP